MIRSLTAHRHRRPSVEPIQVPSEVRAQLERIVFGTMNEARLPATQERKPHHVEAGRFNDPGFEPLPARQNSRALSLSAESPSPGPVPSGAAFDHAPVGPSPANASGPIGAYSVRLQRYVASTIAPGSVAS